MKKLVLSAFALALTACTPILQNASAWLTPSAVELRRGASTEVSLVFVDRAGHNGVYRASIAPMTAGGVTVVPTSPGIFSGNSGTIRYRVSAAPGADLGKRTFNLWLTGKDGHLQQTLTVNVVP